MERDKKVTLLVSSGLSVGMLKRVILVQESTRIQISLETHSVY